MVSKSARATKHTDIPVDGQVATVKGRKKGAPLPIRVRSGCYDYHCDAYDSCYDYRCYAHAPYITRIVMTITAMHMSHISRKSGYKNLSRQYGYSCCEGGRDISTIGGRFSENLSVVETPWFCAGSLIC